jgi:hypothetical protein
MVVRAKGNSRMNKFSFGAQVGGHNYRAAARLQEQQLRDAFNRWTGDYSPDVKEFAFLLRIDGQIHKYTEMADSRSAEGEKKEGLDRGRDWHT